MKTIIDLINYTLSIRICN